MSKLQRHGQLTGRCFATTPCLREDEMYAALYTIEILRHCRICKHHHGQICEGVELGMCSSSLQATKRLLSEG